LIAETSRFGKIEYQKSEVLTMVRGILGFDEYIRFILVEQEGQEPFKWLQSLEKPELAFLIIDPLCIKKDYTVEINPVDLVALKAKNIHDIKILVLVSIPNNQPSLMSANLQAPIAINKREMKAAQLVLSESGYDTSHSIIHELEQRHTEAKASGKDDGSTRIFIRAY
jgi:flagellar assembly factor FliW